MFKIALVVVFLSFSGCITIQIGRSRFISLTAEEKGRVLDLTNNVGNLNKTVKNKNVRTDGFVYEITSDQLLEAMQDYGTNVLYIWSPLCKPDNYVSPESFINYAKKKGWTPWIILEVFSHDVFNTDLGTAIFTVKRSIYKTDKHEKYINGFLIDLGVKLSKKNWERFYFFNKSSFLKQSALKT